MLILAVKKAGYQLIFAIFGAGCVLARLEGDTLYLCRRHEAMRRAGSPFSPRAAAPPGGHFSIRPEH